MRRIFLTYLLLAAGVGAVAAAVWLANAQVIVFEPAEFITKSVDFLASIVAAFFSFLLLQVFWDQHQRQERSAAARQRFRLGLQQLQQIVNASLQLMEREFSERDTEAIRRHEKYVLRQLNQLQFLKQGLAAQLPVPESSEDHWLATTLGRFWAEAAPVIEDLAGREALYPDVEEIRSRLLELQRGFADLTRTLTATPERA